MGGCLSTLCASGTESPTKAEDEQKLEINQNGNPKTLSARGTAGGGAGKDNHAFTDNETLQQLNQVIIGLTYIL